MASNTIANPLLLILYNAPILWSPHKVCELWLVVESECCDLSTTFTFCVDDSSDLLKIGQFGLK